MLVAMADQRKCTRCENTVDHESYPCWCKACRGKWDKEYAEIKQAMAQGKGYAAGVEQMRLLLASQFESTIGSAGVTGHEAALLIMQCPGPKVP
jgi:hypothetical protein